MNKTSYVLNLLFILDKNKHYPTLLEKIGNTYNRSANFLTLQSLVSHLEFECSLKSRPAKKAVISFVKDMQSTQLFYHKPNSLNLEIILPFDSKIALNENETLLLANWHLDHQRSSVLCSDSFYTDKMFSFFSLSRLPAYRS